MNARILLGTSIALGSALGGVARWVLGTWVQLRTGAVFPWGTFAVNVIGALLLGFIVRVSLATPTMGPEMRLALTTGFCGGFTTFSAFSFETALLVERGDYGRAAIYVVSSVVIALVAMFAGFALARLMLVARGRA
jgi:CrcB protein